MMWTMGGTAADDKIVVYVIVAPSLDPQVAPKTSVGKCLLEAVTEIGQDGMWEQVNPKAITSEKLYG